MRFLRKIQVFKENKTLFLCLLVFIGSQAQETTTLEETSNYTASLIANYISFENLQNFTHVDELYIIELVQMQKMIESLAYVGK
jgi:aspartokinase/homoserine dehydrogenase 1